MIHENHQKQNKEHTLSQIGCLCQWQTGTHGQKGWKTGRFLFFEYLPSMGQTFTCIHIHAS